ncbi:MAG: hypothetical protein IJT96_05220 [Lachnospiraceae bacterium]|nr:hypothetical protein [Lachnospiraceae bacterium]
MRIREHALPFFNMFDKNMDVLICNFTGVYIAEGLDFYGDVIDLTDLYGTRMYVDDEAEREIKSRLYLHYGMGGYGNHTIDNHDFLPCIRFIDNGNYHYMTRILASFIIEPFDLITFDHHTDDKEPAFAGLRSCGSWRKDIADENELLKESILIRSYEDFKTSYISSDLPLYISVDKDVLSVDVLKTNWDQGDMREDEFFDIIRELLDNRNVIAFDVCGEDLIEGPCEKNKQFNKKLIGFLKSRF